MVGLNLLAGRDYLTSPFRPEGLWFRKMTAVYKLFLFMLHVGFRACRHEKECIMNLWRLQKHNRQFGVVQQCWLFGKQSLQYTTVKNKQRVYA